MSSWSDIKLDGMLISETQNNYYEWYFRKSERVIETVLASEYYDDPEQSPEEKITIYQYRMSAGTLRRRLTLQGFNRETLAIEFEKQKLQLIEDAESTIPYAPDGDAARFLETLRNSTLDDWVSRLKTIHNRKLEVKYWDEKNIEYGDELLTFMLRSNSIYSNYPTAGYYNFPCSTEEGYATALLEFLPDTAQCILDVTDIISSGWNESFEDLEEYQQDFTRFYEIFKLSIDDINSMMKLDRENLVLAKILYASVITAMETYLADTLKKQVLTRPAIERRFVKNHDAFKDKKIPIASIFERLDTLKSEIAAEIDKISFHNMDKTPGLYKAVLDTEFPSLWMGELRRAVGNRHHIVHRNGKDTAGKPITVNMDDVKQLITLADDVIKHIDKQVKDGLLDDVDTTDDEYVS